MTATPPPGPATTPPPGRGPADLLDFLDFARRAGLITQPTAASYRLGARRVLSALPKQAICDLSALNPDHAVAVFAADDATVTEATRRQYASAFRKAHFLYLSYLADPARWHAAAGQNPAAPGWSTAADRYTVENAAGLSSFTLART